MLEETIIAVVADHGGYRNTHGITPPMIAEVYVPLLLRGMVRDYILLYRQSRTPSPRSSGEESRALG